MKLAAALLAITLLSFFIFPGHTYLQQDTQIYVPILEHQWSGALASDLIVERPHVNFTLYDELTNLVRWVTRAPLRDVLEGEQLVFRGLGFFGIYLIASALGLGFADAVVVTALFGLGATIAAPAVLTIEYEPTPRAFAVPLIFLSIGWLLQRRDWLAGVSGACAFLLHAPTTWPLGVAMLCVLVARRRAGVALIPMAIGAGALVWIGVAQSVAEPQHFLARLGAQQEALQRMRASYNYVSTWWAAWIGQYLLFGAVAALAMWRLRASREIAVVLGSLSMAGLMSVPLSWLLLEHWHFAAIPQIQPARALLFVTAVAVITASVAGCRATPMEAFAWFAFALLAAAQFRFFDWPGARAVVVLMVCAGLLAWSRTRLGMAALLAPAMLWLAGVVPFHNIETPDLAALAQWAQRRTPADAVFVFPQAGRDRAPGWFRGVSLRAVYVDWKGGGQVNYLREFGEEWWRRWQAVTGGLLPPGIDFVVYPRAVEGAAAPVYRNASYVVYRGPGRAI